MPFAMSLELRSPWREFLSEVDRRLPGPVELHCLGGFDERLTDLFPGRFQNLRLLALDAHDLALSKLTRNSPVDRDDVAHLAKTVPLDPALLRTRYPRELRPIVVGDPERHDRTLEMWIQSYFPS